MSLLRRAFAASLALSIAIGPGGLDAYAATLPALVLPPATVVIKDEAACMPCVITDGVNAIISAITLFLWEGSPGIAGMPVYNSANLAPSVWGTGWISDMDHYATVDASGSVTVVGGSGARLTFTKTGTTNGVPVFRAPLGTFLSLTATVDSSSNLTSLTEKDPEGTALLFATPTPAIVGGEPLAPGAVTAFRLTRLTDRNGNTVDYERDPQGRLTKIEDVHGRFFTLSYNAQGKVATLADSGGRSVAFSYDAQGRKTSETGPEGTTSYTYDSNHRITRVTYPNGGVRNYGYDGQGRVITQDDGDGVNTINYARHVSSTVVTDVLSHQTVYLYSRDRGFPLITKVIDHQSHEVALAYDANHNLSSVTDELGRVTTYSYDERGNAVSVRDPTGNVGRASYEPAFNNPTSLSDPFNRTTSLTYNAKGDLTQVKDPLNQISRFSYDAFGHVTSLQDPLGHILQFTYKDSNGALASVTDPLNRTALFETDVLSRLTKVTDPTGKHASFAYDSAGNLTSMTDALGGVTSIAYQPGRGGKVPTTVTDPNNHGLTFHYDAVGRLDKVSNALNQHADVTYDAKSRIQTVISRRGLQTSFAYDSLDRLEKLTTPEGDLDIAYNAAGNIISVQKYNGSAVALTYDSLDRITQEVQTLPGGHTVTLRYGYDANGNRTRMSTPWGDFIYAYDKLDRLVSLTNPYGQTFTFAYDAAGRRTKKTYPNGIETTYAYDAASQLTLIRHRRIADSVDVASAAYTYDAAGNRLTMTDWAGTHTYAYDDGHRLSSATHPSASLLPVKNEVFTYDAAHNRSADAQITSYVYDAADRLQSNSSYTYTNDADGNRTARTGAEGTTEYTWDSSNQLTQVERPDGVTASYKYDVMGQAVEATVATNTTTTERYVRDGSVIIAVLDGNNALKALYTHSGVGREPLSLRRGTSSYFVHDDILSSAVAATGSAGQLEERAEYATYGQPVFESGTSTAAISFTGNLYAYSGAEWAPDAQLSRHGIRYLDPILGRWISEEALGLDGTNRYWYAANNPTAFVDLSGAMPELLEKGLEEGRKLAPYVAPLIAHPDPVTKPALVWIVLPAIVIGVGYAGWVMGRAIGRRLWPEKKRKPATDGAGGFKGPPQIRGCFYLQSPVGRRGNPLIIKPGTNSPAIIFGRIFTGHALDQMQGRGVPPSAVENTIQHGVKTPDPIPGRTRHYDLINDLTVITDTVKGTVISVITGER